MRQESKSAVEISGPSRRHVPALDGVRGLAILLVLVSHLMLFNDRTGSRLGDSLAALRGLGWTGVDLFFVLSGFLITGILYDTLHDPRYFRSFYMRRFLRIFPLYYGFLFFLMILGHWVRIDWGGRQYSLLSYTQNTTWWFPVTDFHPGRWADLEHFWSLAVEEQFYLVWPLLVFLVRDRRRLMVLALVLSGTALLLRIVMYLHGASPMTIFMVTPCRMDTLLLGGWMALALRGQADWLPRRWLMATVWITAAVIAGYTLANLGHDMRDGFFGSTFSYLIIAIGGVALLVSSIDTSSAAHTFFQWRFLRFLGKYSYGIYVLHIFVGYAFGMFMARVLGMNLRNFLTIFLHSRPLAVMVEFLFTSAVVVFAAFLSYRLYEVHFLRLKRFFGYRRTTQVRSVAEPVVAE